MKSYRCALNPSGDPLDDVRVIVVEGRSYKSLDLRLDLRNHSPTGFAWGYSGSGPSQLALAILADVIGDQRAVEGGLYQAFKSAHIANQPRDAGFTLDEAEIIAWVRANERLPNGQYYAKQSDGHWMLCNADGTRSVFDDVDE